MNNFNQQRVEQILGMARDGQFPENNLTLLLCREIEMARTTAAAWKKEAFIRGGEAAANRQMYERSLCYRIHRFFCG